LLLASTLALAMGIYPDDHWSYSTQLTADSIEPEIQKALDGGKTMFVRFIASSG